LFIILETKEAKIKIFSEANPIQIARLSSQQGSNPDANFSIILNRSCKIRLFFY